MVLVGGSAGAAKKEGEGGGAAGGSGGGEAKKEGGGEKSISQRSISVTSLSDSPILRQSRPKQAALICL